MNLPMPSVEVILSTGQHSQAGVWNVGSYTVLARRLLPCLRKQALITVVMWSASVKPCTHQKRDPVHYWQPTLGNGNIPPSRLKNITLSLKTLGKVVDGIKREGNVQWALAVVAACDGSAAWCSKAAWDAHPWEKSCRFLSLWGRKWGKHH